MVIIDWLWRDVLRIAMILRADTILHTADTIFAVACDFYDSDVLILKNAVSNDVVANIIDSSYLQKLCER